MSAGGAGRSEVVERGVRFRWVELWSGAIRTMHWIAAGCIVVLVATGFYIGRPYFMTSGEAIDHFMMGRVRLLHFLAAGILVGTGVIRVYWLFAGNRYEFCQLTVRIRDCGVALREHRSDGVVQLIDYGTFSHLLNSTYSRNRARRFSKPRN